MAGKVCLSEDMLDVCEHGWGNEIPLLDGLLSCSRQFTYTHLWAYTIHP